MMCVCINANSLMHYHSILVYTSNYTGMIIVSNDVFMGGYGIIAVKQANSMCYSTAFRLGL